MLTSTGTSERSKELWAGGEQGSRQRAGSSLRLSRVWRVGLGCRRTTAPGGGLVLDNAVMERFQRKRGWSGEMIGSQWELRVLKL